MFTVVGLIGLGIIIAILTCAVRRRRAQKFDEDVAEAAAEAAATAHRAPNFNDDDDFDRAGPYSDTASHGTYAQPPLQPGEAYNMSELGAFDPYGAAGAAGDPYSAAGAAGIGAAGVNRARSMGGNGTPTPYNAFGGPGGGTNGYFGGYGAQPQGQYGYGGPAAPSHDLLDAAGLGGVAAAASAGLGHGPYPDTGLARNKSMGAQTLGGMSSASEYSSTAHTQATAAQNAGLYQGATQGARPVSTGDPYAAYAGMEGQRTSGAFLPNPFDTPAAPPAAKPAAELPLLGATFASPESSVDHDAGEEEANPGWAPEGQEGSRMSLRDDEDYTFGGGKRVLKVANE